MSADVAVDPAGSAAPQARGSRKGWVRAVTGGAPLYPLAILFGLNAVDQADQRIFALLAPNIRDNFHLDNSEFLLIVALGLVLGLLLSIPFGFAADRIPRLPIVIGGAVAFGVFSMFTGLATSIWMLVIARAGTAFGTAVSNPTHNSLLADYYDIPDRPKVYSVHRAALAVGVCLGPLDGRTADVLVQLARAVHPLHRAHHDLRDPRVLAPRADPRSLRAEGHGRRRRHRRDRGRGAVVRGVVAGVLEHRHAAAHLLRPAVPRGGVHRAGDLRLALLRAGVPPRCARPRIRVRARRTSPAHRPAPDDPHPHPPVRAQRDAGAPLRRDRRRRRRGRLDRVRAQPQPRDRGRPQRARDRARGADRPADLRLPVARHPAEDPVLRLRGRRRCGSCPASFSCPSSVPSPTSGASGPV